ncbi:MAG: hypothetical protein PHV74_13210 [Dehalococcoidia bacterium]|nr:hypothetical protein [Dehalococcoidia bacterium]
MKGSLIHIVQTTQNNFGRIAFRAEIFYPCYKVNASIAKIASNGRFRAVGTAIVHYCNCRRYINTVADV